MRGTIQDLFGVFMNECVCFDIIAELVVLLLIWKFTKNEKMGYLQEVGLFSQFFDGITTVAKYSFIT